MTQSAIVTGANRGIGFAIVNELLMAETHDVLAIVRDASTANALRERFSSFYSDRKLTIKTADLANHREVKILCTEIRMLKNCSVLINNAGVFSFGTLNIEQLDFTSMLYVNFTTPVLLTEAVVDNMKERQAGNIINIGSSAGRKGLSGVGLYGATKHALTGFSESLMKELISSNIKVTTINPAFVDTDMTRNFVGMQGKLKIHVEDIVNSIRLILSLSEGAVIPHIDIECASVVK